MIDRTSDRIQEEHEDVRRRNMRRYAFHRLLQATDRALWRLEELNRDGVITVPKHVRAELRKLAATMPDQVRGGLADAERVQPALDELFDAQERLFRWRYPDWHDFDPAAEGPDTAVS